MAGHGMFLLATIRIQTLALHMKWMEDREVSELMGRRGSVSARVDHCMDDRLQWERAEGGASSQRRERVGGVTSHDRSSTMLPLSLQLPDPSC